MSIPLYERLALLSEPLRARMLRVLEQAELSVGELARVLQTSQPTVSRHLKQLHAAGLVHTRKVGTASLVRLDPRELPEGAGALWDLVRAELEAEAVDPRSQLAEDARRLDGVLAQRAGDSEALFRMLGSRWDEVRQELFGAAYVLPALLALLPEGQVIADLGCGTGAMLPLLAPVAGRLLGVDREEAMLAVAAERCSGLPNVELRQGLLDALPLQGGSVDLALCQLVLHHVRELPPVFAEVARVLRPGGRFVLLDMVAHDRDELRATMGHVHPGFDEDTVRGLAVGAGLRLRSFRVLPPDPEAQGPGLFVATMG